MSGMAKISVFAFMLGLGSCGGKQQTTEEQAAAKLSEARSALAAKEYGRARTAILELRRSFPTALAARRAAILTLDSVEMLESHDSICYYEPLLTAARQRLATLEDNPDGRADSTYIAQRIAVFKMEQHFDELCAKTRFFRRKLDIDINSM